MMVVAVGALAVGVLALAVLTVARARWDLDRDRRISKLEMAEHLRIERRGRADLEHARALKALWEETGRLGRATEQLDRWTEERINRIDRTINRIEGVLD